MGKACLKAYQELVDLGEYQTNEIEEKRKQLLKVQQPQLFLIFIYFTHINKTLYEIRENGNDGYCV